MEMRRPPHWVWVGRGCSHVRMSPSKIRMRVGPSGAEAAWVSYFAQPRKNAQKNAHFGRKKSEKKMFRKVKNRENAKVDQKNRKNGTKFTELWGKCQWFFFCGGAAASKMERFLGQPPAEGQVVLADHHKGHPGEEQRGMGRGRVVQILQVVWGLGDFSRTPRGGGGSSW